MSCGTSCNGCANNCIVGRVNLEVLDSATVDLELTAGPNPYVLTASVILDPNPPGDDTAGGNLIMEGPNGLYLTCEQIQDCIGEAVAATMDGITYSDATNALLVDVTDIDICGALIAQSCPLFSYSSEGGTPIDVVAGDNLDFTSSDDSLTIDTSTAGVIDLVSNCCPAVLPMAGTPADPDAPTEAEALATWTAGDGPIYVYYVGNGTATDPDYTWFIDAAGNIMNTESPGGLSRIELIDDDCRIQHTASDGTVTDWYNSEVDHGSEIITLPGFQDQGYAASSLIASPTTPAAGTMLVGPVASASITNPSACRNMTVAIFTERNANTNATGVNVYSEWRQTMLLDDGDGILSPHFVDISTATSNVASNGSDFNTLNNEVSSRIVWMDLAPGQTKTVRCQSELTFLGGNAASGSTVRTGLRLMGILR